MFIDVGHYNKHLANYQTLVEKISSLPVSGNFYLLKSIFFVKFTSLLLGFNNKKYKIDTP